MHDAYLPRPPVTYLVAGLIELPSLVALYGAPGCLKSFLLADLAICVAAGLPFLPGLPGEMEPGAGRLTVQQPVLWADFDNGRRRTLERFDALGKARRVSPDIPLTFYTMPSPWLDGGSPDSVGDLTDRAMRLGAKLIVVDNLGATSGAADENSADMVKVLSNFRQVSECSGASCVLVHHQRKSNGFTGRAGESLRGHSGIEAALDLALLVERELGSNTVTVKSTKTRGVDVPPFAADFSFDHSDDGDLASARFWGIPADDTHSDKSLIANILATVTETHPINQTALVKALAGMTLPPMGRGRIIRMLDRLVREHSLTATSGANNAKLFDLP
jgi:hypothetical protein